MKLLDGLFDVSGKTVAVTGGSRGIGYMIARGFVEGGAAVIISARNVDACNKAAQELSEFGTCIRIRWLCPWKTASQVWR